MCRVYPAAAGMFNLKRHVDGALRLSCWNDRKHTRHAAKSPCRAECKPQCIIEYLPNNREFPWASGNIISVSNAMPPFHPVLTDKIRGRLPLTGTRRPYETFIIIPPQLMSNIHMSESNLRRFCNDPLDCSLLAWSST